MARFPAHDHTDRLCLRAPSFADLRSVATIHADPRTNMHNPHGPSAAADSVRMIRTWIRHWADGAGYWCVRLRIHGEHGPVIGVGGVRLTDSGRFNLYYRFSPAVWGRGLATELARHAVLRAGGFRAAGEIVALVRPGNEASIIVAERAGLRRAGQISDAHGPQILLRSGREEGDVQAVEAEDGAQGPAADQ